jgi:diacylglycerol O-acyltransferase-1
MATIIDTAVMSGASISVEASRKRASHSHAKSNTNAVPIPQPLAPIRTHMKKKYRHVAAVHSKPRTSCLSHDSESTPSFLGFRNLMVIVLSTSNQPRRLVNIADGFDQLLAICD